MHIRQILDCVVRHTTDYGYEFETFANPAAAQLAAEAYHTHWAESEPEFAFDVMWRVAWRIEYTDARFGVTCIVDHFIGAFDTLGEAQQAITPDSVTVEKV